MVQNHPRLNLVYFPSAIQYIPGKFLSSLSINLPKRVLEMDIEPLLTLVSGMFFHDRGVPGLVSVLSRVVPPPTAPAATKRMVERYYTGPLDGSIAQDMINCDPSGKLMVHTHKHAQRANTIRSTLSSNTTATT